MRRSADGTGAARPVRVDAIGAPARCTGHDDGCRPVASIAAPSGQHRRPDGEVAQPSVIAAHLALLVAARNQAATGGSRAPGD
jgi:hypothetical protein